MARSRLVNHLVDDSLAESTLNIRPIMNLFVILIPFLLLSASFVNYSMIPIHPPATGDAVPKAATPDLQVVLTPKGPKINLKSSTGRRLKRKAYAWTALQDFRQALHQIKDKYPELDSATFKVRRGVSFEKMIATMDQVRGSDVEDAKERVLFPSIVLGGDS